MPIDRPSDYTDALGLSSPTLPEMSEKWCDAADELEDHIDNHPTSETTPLLVHASRDYSDVVSGGGEIAEVGPLLRLNATAPGAAVRALNAPIEDGQSVTVDVRHYDDVTAADPISLWLVQSATSPDTWTAADVLSGGLLPKLRIELVLYEWLSKWAVQAFYYSAAPMAGQYNWWESSTEWKLVHTGGDITQQDLCADQPVPSPWARFRIVRDGDEWVVQCWNADTGEVVFSTDPIPNLYDTGDPYYCIAGVCWNGDGTSEYRAFHLSGPLGTPAGYCSPWTVGAALLSKTMTSGDGMGFEGPFVHPYFQMVFTNYSGSPAHATCQFRVPVAGTYRILIEGGDNGNEAGGATFSIAGTTLGHVVSAGGWYLLDAGAIPTAALAAGLNEFEIEADPWTHMGIGRITFEEVVA